MRLGRGPQSSDEQIQTVLVLGQQGSRRLVVLPQDEVHQLDLGPQQGRGVGAALFQEPIENRKQGGQDGLRAGQLLEVVSCLFSFSHTGAFLLLPGR